MEMLKGAMEFFRYFNNITMIIEEKFSGESQMMAILNQYAQFEYGDVDRFNIYAKKIATHRS